MNIAPHTDLSLLARVTAGDEAAFRELFDQYWDNIYGVALAFTKSPELAEEIVQDIFVKVWQKKDQLAGIERFDNWLFIIARNHIFNTLRREIRNLPFTEGLIDYFQSAGDKPDQRLLLRESEALVRQAVEQLSPQQQRVWTLSRAQGLTQDEIAAEMAISRSTVKSHMSKALESVREYLRSHADETLFLLCLLKAFL